MDGGSRAGLLEPCPTQWSPESLLQASTGLTTKLGTMNLQPITQGHRNTLLVLTAPQSLTGGPSRHAGGHSTEGEILLFDTASPPYHFNTLIFLSFSKSLTLSRIPMISVLL